MVRQDAALHPRPGASTRLGCKGAVATSKVVESIQKLVAQFLIPVQVSRG